MRKVIIVEGKQDTEFIKALAPTLEVKSIEIKELGGAGKSHLEKLQSPLQALKNDNAINPIEKIGILLDLDPKDFTVESRLAFVNESVEKVFGVKLLDTSVFQQVSDSSIQITCYFIKPNLDVLLRKIASKPSPSADCLYRCLETQANIGQKEKDKAWPLYYMRWDICDAKERRKGLENVSFKCTDTKEAWNLNALLLEDLKTFLSLF